ncbi:MAG: hypothetical protein ABIO70_28305 [Pseudomonadota bacterium]
MLSIALGATLLVIACCLLWLREAERTLVEAIWHRRLVPFALVVAYNDGACRASSSEAYLEMVYGAVLLRDDGSGGAFTRRYREVPPREQMAVRLAYEVAFSLPDTDEVQGRPRYDICDCGSLLSLETWGSFEVFDATAGTLVKGGTAQDYAAYCGGRSNVAFFGGPLPDLDCRCAETSPGREVMEEAASLAATDPRAALASLLRAANDPGAIREVRSTALKGW